MRGMCEQYSYCSPQVVCPLGHPTRWENAHPPSLMLVVLNNSKCNKIGRDVFIRMVYEVNIQKYSAWVLVCIVRICYKKLMLHVFHRVIAVGLRSSLEFFSFLQLFKHTLYDITKQTQRPSALVALQQNKKGLLAESAIYGLQLVCFIA